MNTFIRLLYALLIAAAVVTFVGVGIYAFYPPPKGPDYPKYEHNYGDDSYYNSQAYQDEQKKYDDAVKKHEEVENEYFRNVTTIALPLAVLALVGGLLLMKSAEVIGEGLALGAVAISIYSITTASMANHRTLLFASVTVFLAAALVIPYQKFLAKKA